MTADTFLVTADEIHSQEPLDEWQLGVLEDSTDKAGEVLATGLATELAVLANGTMVSSAIGTYNVTVSPTRLDDGLLALCVRGEVGREGNDVVELLEINHIHCFVG